MNDPRETARRLLELALHEGTPESEKNAAAMGLARIVKKLRLLEGPSISLSSPSPPRERRPDVSADAGPLSRGLVVMGDAAFCRECVARPRKRGDKAKPTIPRGETAFKNEDGTYTHQGCRGRA